MEVMKSSLTLNSSITSLDPIMYIPGLRSSRRVELRLVLRAVKVNLAPWPGCSGSTLMLSRAEWLAAAKLDLYSDRRSLYTRDEH